MGERAVARYTTNASLAVLTANRPPSDAAPSQIGPRSAHHLHLVGLDFKDDSDLVRLSPWILVLAQVFLGEGIDMRVCALFGHVLDPPTNLDVPIGIVGVEDRKRHRRAFRHIACLHTTFRRIHPDLAVRVVEPYRGHLRRPIRHDCREVSESRFLLQQIQILRGNFHHDCLSSRSLCVTSARGTSQAAVSVSPGTEHCNERTVWVSHRLAAPAPLTLLCRSDTPRYAPIFPRRTRWLKRSSLRTCRNGWSSMRISISPAAGKRDRCTRATCLSEGRSPRRHSC